MYMVSKFKELEEDVDFKGTFLMPPTASQQVCNPETWLFQLQVFAHVCFQLLWYDKSMFSFIKNSNNNDKKPKLSFQRQSHLAVPAAMCERH